MPTACITHPACAAHSMIEGHPEDPPRLHAIENRLIAQRLLDLMIVRDAPQATRKQMARVDNPGSLRELQAIAPREGLAHIDSDTSMSPRTLPAGRGFSQGMRQAVTDTWVPALDDFAPQFYIVSAGFDAHREDQLSPGDMVDADYGWITGRIMTLADRHAGGRIVSTLEGGKPACCTRTPAPDAGQVCLGAGLERKT